MIFIVVWEIWQSLNIAMLMCFMNNCDVTSHANVQYISQFKMVALTAMEEHYLETSLSLEPQLSRPRILI